MKAVKIPKMEYLPKQGTFMRNCDLAVYSGYIGGFGSGKTHVLGLQSLRDSARRSRGLIGAPTYKMLEDTTQRKFFDLLPHGWIRSFHGQKNQLTLVNGTEILFRSMENPDRLAGLDLDWFGIDEIGSVKESTFKMLQGRLRKRDSVRHGFGVGNPAGPAHWTYKYFVTLAAEYPKKYSLIQAPSHENTFNPPEYVEDMGISFGKDTAYYKQYVLGQFVAFEGAFWPNFNPLPFPAGHVMNMEHVREFVRKGGVRFGRVIDFGFEHPFVCLWFVTNGKTIIFFDEYRQQHGLIQHHCMTIRHKEEQHYKTFGPHGYIVSWTDHEAVSRAEISAAKDSNGLSIGFDCSPVEKKVMESILLVQSLFGLRRLFVTENCKRTILEIPSYHSREGIVGEEPERTEEDACCCLRYGCWGEMNHVVPYRRFRDMGYSLAEIDDIFEVNAWPV